MVFVFHLSPQNWFFLLGTTHCCFRTVGPRGSERGELSWDERWKVEGILSSALQPSGAQGSPGASSLQGPSSPCLQPRGWKCVQGGLTWGLLLLDAESDLGIPAWEFQLVLIGSQGARGEGNPPSEQVVGPEGATAVSHKCYWERRHVQSLCSWQASGNLLCEILPLENDPGHELQSDHSWYPKGFMTVTWKNLLKCPTTGKNRSVDLGTP